ncbi:WD40 repeat domain-containing protein [Streptomyces sp. NPDC090108]|uniref:WD40 repeat domain-containing protein n=1 Tax=Streptomyces sp. NPDC090108 TaxID=3365947 RepID=UPI0038251D7F
MTEGSADNWGRPAAGREPAAAALLAWLADRRAPRLCLVTGGAGSGKSTLLAWLVGHGTRPGTRGERRVHGFVPLDGESALTAGWTLARQLLVAARTPGELVARLAADGRRTVLVLPDLHAADDPDAVTELVLALLELEHVRLVVETRSDTAAALRRAAAAVMDLDDPQWADPERYAAWAATRPQEAPGSTPTPGGPVATGGTAATGGPVATGGTAVTEGPGASGGATAPGSAAAAAPAAPDLDDPGALCAADPWRVTRLFERSGDGHGGLRAAWLRAGPALTHTEAPAERAVVLHAALGDDTDPRHPRTLASLAGSAAWRVVWRRVRGDVRPPWPGPALALAAGRGELAGKLLAADDRGTVRVVAEADAAPVGRLAQTLHRPRGLAVWADGSVLGLDGDGTLHLRPGAPAATGLAALLDDGPTPLERLVDDVNAHLKDHPGTVTAASGTFLAVADASGRAHAFLPGDSGPRTAALHEGPVSALAALDLPVSGDGPGVPLLYSGGLDGTVRSWGPSAEPMETPLRARPCPVTALAAAATGRGLSLAVAWADGTVELHGLDGEEPARTFAPGPPVRSLALTGSGVLLVGTDETLTALAPR